MLPAALRNALGARASLITPVFAIDPSKVDAVRSGLDRDGRRVRATFVSVLDAHCPFVVEVGTDGALGVWLGPAALALEPVDADRLDWFLHARVGVESAADEIGVREERCTVHAAVGHDAADLRRRARTDAPRSRVKTRTTDYRAWLDALGR